MARGQEVSSQTDRSLSSPWSWYVILRWSDCADESGPIGIAVVHCLRAFGVSTIVVSEPSASRGHEAKKAGALHVLDPLKEDVTAFCRSLDHGRGVHFVFDCAGIQAAYDVGLASVRGKGVIINVAIFETPLVIKEPNKVCRGQITIVGSSIYTRGEFQEVIDAISTG